MGKPIVGVLALQGDFEAHARALERAGASVAEVRTGADLHSLDGLVIPGGESTTMLRLIGQENLFDDLQRFGRCKPVFGTCAGAILLATEVLHPHQDSLGLMDLSIERNAYGRQIDSRIAALDLDGAPTEAVFIRAPVIRRVGPDVQVLAEYGGDPVLAEQGKHLVATFHPELTSDVRIHRRFVAKVQAAKEQAAKEQAAKEQAAKEQAAKEQAAMDEQSAGQPSRARPTQEMDSQSLAEPQCRALPGCRLEA